MKKNNRKWLWLVLGLAVAAMGGYFFIRWSNRDIVEIKTMLVGRGTIEEIVSASGQVDAPVYNLGPKLGGKIVRLNVREGDRVREGMTLAEFDDTTRIVAPANGVVARINYEEGETVVPGSPAIVVVNHDQSRVEAQIDEVDIAGVRTGDKVKITSDVYPDKVYMGEIYWIAPVAELRKVGGRIKLDEESYVFPCKVRFLGAHAELKVNMSVNVDIVTRKKENALIVPRETLVSVDDSSAVFSVRNDRVFQNKIDIGLRSFSSVEAVAGVAEGETIAASNLSRLKDKGRVKIER